MNVFNYRKLIVYQKSKELVKKTYKLLQKFPSQENFGLVSQLSRASVSVVSNIAEGVNRFNCKDKKHFIEISYGSLMELSSQFEIAEDLGYITRNDRIDIDILVEEIARLLSGLRNSYNK